MYLKVDLSIFILLFHSVNSLYVPPREEMIQRQACSFTPYSKQLTCRCIDHETNSALKLELSFFIIDKGQEVRSVLIESCPNIKISLDLTGINPTKIPIKFKNCEKVSLDSINFDPRFSGAQMMSLIFERVAFATFENIAVEEALMINTNLVKELRIDRSNFTHIPLPGFSITNTDKLSITNSVFLRSSEGSIDIQSGKEVMVVNNKFNINAIKVVKSKAGSSLYISCNTLLDEPTSPECVQTSPAPTTVAFISTTSPPPPTTTTNESFDQAINFSVKNDQPVLSDAQNNLVSLELLIGLVVGVGLLLLLLLFIVIYLCCKRKNKVKKKEEDQDLPEEKVGIMTEKEGDKDSGNNSSGEIEDSEEKDSLLMPETPEKDVDQLVEASKPRFSSPIWLDEIHNNKIFNKQRSIINTEDLVNTPHRPERPFPVRSISEIIEPESDNEDNLAASDQPQNESSTVNIQESDYNKNSSEVQNENVVSETLNQNSVPETDF